MKELSIEQKAKRYDEAIETARKINSGEGVAAPPDWTTCEVIFPELAKSEGERIRKALIEGFKVMKDGSYGECTFSNYNIPVTDIIFWLEKQGMPAKYHDICDKCVRQPTCQSDCFLQQDEQKNDWGEEDKKMIIKICQNLYDYPRIKSPFNDESFNEAQKEVQFIKSLRPQIRWKPSDEQMKTLKEACDEHWEPDGLDPLYTLYQDLKKFREE